LGESTKSAYALWHADFADSNRQGGFKKNIVTIQLVLLWVGSSFSWSYGDWFHWL